MKIDDHNYYTYDLFNSFKQVAGKMKKEGSHITYPEELSWNSVSQWLYHTKQQKSFFFRDQHINLRRPLHSICEKRHSMVQDG